MRWPDVRAVIGCSAAAAIAVAIDTYFSAQEGYLAQPPSYEGIGYLQFARTAYLLIRHLHLRSALHQLDSIAPLWTVLQTLQYFVVGDGLWQAFTVRFWPVALLLILVYWVVRNRATPRMAVAAVAVTALLPMMSASVRASSWEFFSGLANYPEDWGLDDLRPDFLAAVLGVWSIAALAEHSRAPRRSAYVVSAIFAAAAIQTKPSTATFALAAWALALGVLWLWRRDAATLRLTGLALGVLALLLIPWAIVGGGLVATVQRLYEAAVTYSAAYASSVRFPERFTYYAVRIPSQVGQVESILVIPGVLFLVLMLWRRRLDRPEVMYAGATVFFYVAFTLVSNKVPNIGEYVSLPLWLFLLASLSRLVAARWSLELPRISTVAAGVAAAYVLVAYVLGWVGVYNWPAPERAANAQLTSVTNELAGELSHHMSGGDCFTYAPGPGWPASLEFLLTDSNGSGPRSTPIDVNPATTTTSDYIATASQCPAIVVYREDITQVAQVFFCPPVRQTYLRALADWVKNPGSGYALFRTWHLNNLPPIQPHALGRYQGVSLTVDLYLRSPG